MYCDFYNTHAPGHGGYQYDQEADCVWHYQPCLCPGYPQSVPDSNTEGTGPAGSPAPRLRAQTGAGGGHRAEGPDPGNGGVPITFWTPPLQAATTVPSTSISTTARGPAPLAVSSAGHPAPTPTSLQQELPAHTHFQPPSRQPPPQGCAPGCGASWEPRQPGPGQQKQERQQPPLSAPVASHRADPRPRPRTSQLGRVGTQPAGDSAPGPPGAA